MDKVSPSCVSNHMMTPSISPMSQFFLDEIEAATRCMTLNDFLARLQDNVEPGLAHLPVNHDRTDATSSATKRIKSTSS